MITVVKIPGKGYRGMVEMLDPRVGHEKRYEKKERDWPDEDARENEVGVEWFGSLFRAFLACR
jgi:hypothetical protein